MKPITVLVILSALALSRAAVGQEPPPTFVLGFEGAPERLTGGAGEVKTFEVYVTLTTLDNTSPRGVQGWSIVMGVTGGKFRSISLQGVEVSTIFDHDGDPLTPPLDPHLQDLAGAGFEVSGIDRDPLRVDGCAISAVVLNYTRLMELEPTGTQRIARLAVEATIPTESDCSVLDLKFTECARGGQPINNIVTFHGGSWPPQRESAQVLLCRAHFRRGDFNGDGAVDISDAISNLGYLYLGAAAPGCRSAADSNDDGYVDITDPVILLSDLFRPEVDSLLPPPGPFACGIGLRGDPLGCDRYPPCP